MAHLPKPSSSWKSPSTPNRKGGKSSLFSQAPSTTPAGDPPSYLTNKSTTPSGQPPRSSKIFGSSYNAANNTFGHRNTPGQRGRAFAVPESSPPPDEEDDQQDAPGELMDEGYGTQTGRQADDIPFLSSLASNYSSRGLKRSRDGQIRQPLDSGMPEIARSYAADNGAAQLHDADDIILQTESILSTSDSAIQRKAFMERGSAITTTAAYLTSIWRPSSDLKTNSGGIGPDSDGGLTRANYLASLLLQLHHPHSTTPTSSSIVLASQGALARPSNPTAISVPKALLDWLNTYHRPLPDDFNEIHMFRPSPSAHESFWDVVGGELLRGRFARVIRLLKDAGFENAVTAQDDGNRRAGYEGKQLDNVEEVVEKFVRLLENCPSLKYEDWDVRGAQWSLFRQQLRHGIQHLEIFAKGRDEDNDGESIQPGGNVFSQSASGSMFGSMASASIRAESRVPWSVYENLRVLYNVLMGGDEIMDYSQDWLESSIFLTVWWDGNSGPAPDLSIAGQRSLRQSRGPTSIGAGTREVDVSPLAAYRRRLGESLANVTAQIEESNFTPDTLDPVQVGLVCVMEDSTEAVIELLETWDQTLAAATVEIAAFGGWLPQARTNSRGLLQQGFSSEDLMVLSQGPGQQLTDSHETVNRDEVLTSYADLLATKSLFRSSDGKHQREGWELAVSVLGRLDDAEAAQAKITTILESIQFDDESRVDKVLELCASMGLVQQARAIAERYADRLAESDSNAYGAALVYYARGHATQKLTATMSFLISCCLLQSAAVPADSQTDDLLASLLSHARPALVALATIDLEAATLLSGQISGYATMRRFYTLRDESAALSNSLKEKREAASALIALIESASDCIRGGLFDPSVQSVVPIDGLLVLLGEALPILGQAQRIFTKPQIFSLMRVVEDFDTAPARVQESAVDLFRASVNTYHGGTTSSSQLQKSTNNVGASMSASGLSGSSSWDMVMSSNLMRSQESVEGGKGWDWRKGLDGVGGARVDSKQVLVLLRTALAEEVARGWGGGFGW